LQRQQLTLSPPLASTFTPGIYSLERTDRCRVHSQHKKPLAFTLRFRAPFKLPSRSHNLNVTLSPPSPPQLQLCPAASWLQMPQERLPPSILQVNQHIPLTFTTAKLFQTTRVCHHPLSCFAQSKPCGADCGCSGCKNSGLRPSCSPPRCSAGAARAPLKAAAAAISSKVSHSQARQQLVTCDWLHLIDV
jgi:hypothetical protein